MNYSTIQFAREQLNKFENNYWELKKKVNLSLFAVSRTNLSDKEKNKVWDGLFVYTNNIIRDAEKILDELKNVRFSSDEIILHEEKDKLVQKYRILIKELRKEEGAITRQVKESKPITVAALWQKDVEEGYCYFCDISTSDDFSYKLRFEEQSVLGIEIAEGAVFCSEKCLKSYCKEYKNREKLRQEEEKRSKEKIEEDRKMVTEIQGQITHLTEKINRLERKEQEIELMPESYQIERPESAGFWTRFGRKLGLVKKPSPLSKLEKVRKLKGELNIQLEKEGEKLQKSLIILSLDEQKEKERKRIEEKLFLKKAKIALKQEEISDE